jgi:ornithine cyclodeaminase
MARRTRPAWPKSMPSCTPSGWAITKFPPQTRIEGEIQQLDPDHPVTELWQVITGAVPGRRDAGQITLFDSVGFALEDFAALTFLNDTARELGIGADADTDRIQ